MLGMRCQNEVFPLCREVHRWFVHSQRRAKLVAAAQPVDPRTDAGDIERIKNVRPKWRHAVDVATQHSINDQRRGRIARRDQACVWNIKIAPEWLNVAGVGIGEGGRVA